MSKCYNSLFVCYVYYIVLVNYYSLCSCYFISFVDYCNCFMVCVKLEDYCCSLFYIDWYYCCIDCIND